MNKRLFKTILFLMGLSLVGLLMLQAFWVLRSLNGNEKRLKHNTYQALNEVAKKIEECKTLKVTSDFIQQRNPSTCIDTQHNNQYNEVVGYSSYSYQKNGNSSYEEHITVSRDYTPNVLKTRSIPEEMIQKEFDKYQIVDSLNDQRKVLREHFSKLDAHSQKTLQKILSTLMTKPISLEQSISPKLLKVYIEQALTKRGIDTKYKFGILDTYQSSIILPYENKDLSTFKELYQGYTVPLKKDYQEQYLLGIYYPKQDQYIWQKTSLVLISSSILLAIIFACFYLSIKMIRTQKKVSDIKNDFINNVTHELKTPIATISLATEALMDEDIKHHKSFTDRYIKVIKSENQRLSKQVEKILQIATLESTTFEIKPEKIDINAIINEIASHFVVPIESRQGTLNLDLTPAPTTLKADPFHITNVIYNLIDNANKYSEEAPQIILSTKTNNDTFVISVKDQGLGISKEHQKHIFEKFYRVPTGNLHNVKGFGLGLSYVKKIIDFHEGSMTIKSELGKGSEFIVSLPLIK